MRARRREPVRPNMNNATAARLFIRMQRRNPPQIVHVGRCRVIYIKNVDIGHRIAMSRPAARRARGMSADSLDRDIWLFYLAYRQMVKIPDPLLTERGLGRFHHRLLFVIGHAGESSVGSIAERLTVSRQALHGPMRQLRQAGLIESRPSSENRTVQLVALTPEGAALEKKLNTLQHRHLEAALQDAGPEAANGWRLVMSGLSRAAVRR